MRLIDVVIYYQSSDTLKLYNDVADGKKYLY